MVNSIADALSSTGSIPPVNASQLSGGSPPVAPKTDSAASGQHQDDIAAVDKAATDRDIFTKEGRPTFPVLAPEPKNDAPDDPVKGYVSAIGLMGAIGSMFTRTPMVNSMNSAAAALNSMKASDAVAFKQNYETWKTHNDNALKLFDYQNQTYKSIMADKNKSVDERIAEMRANATAFKDDLMMKLVEERNPSVIEENIAKAEDARASLGKKTEEMTALGNKNLAFLEKKKQLDEDKASGKITQSEYAQGLADAANTAKGGSKASTSTIDAKAIDQKVEALHKGATYSSIGLSQRTSNNPNKDAVDEALAKKYPDFDYVQAQLDYAGGKANRVTQERRGATAEQGAGELEQLIPATKASLKKLDLSKFPDWNSFQLYAKQHTGDPDVAEAYTNLQETQNAYTALLVRGGQRTDAAQAASEHLMNLAFAPKAADRVLDTMAANSTRILKGIDNAKHGKIGENTTASSSFPLPPAEAIQQLKAAPDTAPHFDEVFGPGAAKKILGQ